MLMARVLRHPLFDNASAVDSPPFVFSRRLDTGDLRVDAYPSSSSSNAFAILGLRSRTSRSPADDVFSLKSLLFILASSAWMICIITCLPHGDLLA